VIAASLAFFFLHETPGVRELGGFALIAAGLALVAVAASRRARGTAAE
jgi:drug/metabolite transporter (DMT)-like permease